MNVLSVVKTVKLFMSYVFLKNIDDFNLQIKILESVRYFFLFVVLLLFFELNYLHCVSHFSYQKALQIALIMTNSRLNFKIS